VKLLAKICLATLLLAAAVLLGSARPAAAASPCWKTLLNDWYDGRIDHTYPVSCYHQALKHLPTDVQTYSSARDDIERALQSAIAHERKLKKKVGPGTLLPPSETTGKGKGKTTTAGNGTTTIPSSATLPGNKPGGGLASELNPSSPSSLPIPLLVLGGLAILLVAAGAVGVVAKRLQGRRPGS